MSKKKIFEKDSNLANENSGFAANEYEREPSSFHGGAGGIELISQSSQLLPRILNFRELKY